MKMTTKTEKLADWENPDLEDCYYCGKYFPYEKLKRVPGDDNNTPICASCLSNWCDHCQEPKYNMKITVYQNNRLYKQFCNYEELQMRMLEEYC